MGLAPHMSGQGSYRSAFAVASQVEQVLETYFMNLDNTYNKLQTLGEYVDDTEDYVRFEIDTQRNRFIEVRAWTYWTYPRCGSQHSAARPSVHPLCALSPCTRAHC